METITKLHKQFNELRAICKCQGNNAPRQTFNHLFVDANSVVATNGRILAKIKNVFGLTLGFHDIIKNTKQQICLESVDVDGKYPEYYYILDFDKEQAKSGCLTSNLAVDLYHIAWCDVCINPDYLAILEDLNFIEYFVIDKDRPVHFTGKNGFHAVIMPIKY